MKIFDHFQHINLTNDQSNALESIETFLNGDGKVFLLKGYAGTGKTTMLNGICRYLTSQQSDYQLMAPTGRAAMILAQKTGADASTIHRGIYNMDELHEKKHGTSFKFYFDLKQTRESTRCVYLIDESSMISDVYSDDEFFTFGSGCLLKDLMNYVLSEGTNRKIILVGDDAQLPPVDMNFSPALDGDYLYNQYQLSSKTATLTQVVRQGKESGILDSATNIRAAIASNVFNSFEINYGKGDTFQISPENFMDHYTQMTKKGGVQESIVITHSNRQALEYNQQIRERKYGYKHIEVQEEDWLMITRNNYHGSVELFNGMFAKVLEVGGISYQANPRYIIEGGKTIERKLVFREVRVEIIGIDGTCHQLRTTLLDNFLSSREGKLHPHDQRALYIDFKERMSENGIKPGTKEFIESLKKDKYFNSLQAKFGYAITCHKSQGGEWENAFVDFNVYIGKSTKGFFRWSYTAITRSSRQLYCIDAPQYNALSQFVVRDIEKISNVMAGAVYFPRKEGEPLYFVQCRKQRIEQLCHGLGLTCVIKEPNYQLDLNFSCGEKFTRLQLWYTNQGFSKQTWHSFNDEAFKAVVEGLLLESLLPEQVPFEPKFEFQKELHHYFLEVLSEEGVVLTNIIQNQWNDQYFLHTGADCAMVEFCYNNNHQYTFAKPRSTAGLNDQKLNSIVNTLRA